MFLVFVSLLAAAAAAPQYFHQSIHHGSDYFPHHSSNYPHYPNRGYFPEYQSRSPFDSFFEDNIFDTRRFWSDLSTELRELDNVLADFYRRFPSSVSREGIEGHDYKITIPLNGFDEKDIIVKARQGLLMVQAVHKIEETVVKSYLDVRNLPDSVNVTGSWVYDKGVLKITFPLKDDAVVDENKGDASEAPTTEAPSREAIEPSEDNTEDADVGLNRGDDVVASEQEHMLQTNEVPNNTVEATTYAVDVKGDVEFVPIE
ncbi:uncharacterized protein LOC115448696 [Manduca sexta]|uniref:Uncharacterized protein n=1 Tax=Manduca sexta TaxID=7130 RepID=A0A922CD88_MANSE|nr:uncharacterized protein LOC115448696 [Manduca sexta]KAG6441922.1 hypothetical protein O3G_MSEX002045 [Manduca sexta]